MTHPPEIAFAFALTFQTLAEAGVWGVVAVTGLVSAAVALALPPSPIGLPGWVYMLLPVLTGTYATSMNRRRERLYGPASSGMKRED